MFSSGNTMFPGIAERLESELKARSVSHVLDCLFCSPGGFGPAENQRQGNSQSTEKVGEARRLF